MATACKCKAPMREWPRCLAVLTISLVSRSGSCDKQSHQFAWHCRFCQETLSTKMTFDFANFFKHMKRGARDRLHLALSHLLRNARRRRGGQRLRHLLNLLQLRQGGRGDPAERKELQATHEGPVEP